MIKCKKIRFNGRKQMLSAKLDNNNYLFIFRKLMSDKIDCDWQLKKTFKDVKLYEKELILSDETFKQMIYEYYQLNSDKKIKQVLTTFEY